MEHNYLKYFKFSVLILIYEENVIFFMAGMAGGGMTQAMGGYYGAAYGPLGASMAAAAAAAAQQNAISAALTPNAQVIFCGL